MSLHGPLMVTGESIAYWDAQRTEPLRGHDEFHEYVCVIYYVSPAGRPTAVRYRFPVRHRYSDGALALASKVLAKAAELEAAEQ